ncbi:MAG: molecular chaperone HtpG [Gammaproteobacteria bacterium RBG_16_57_12]|nr:MAG: molecular chaperone HtpG [Gammaproteobacteria bacterium RBG_16_57_12]
MTVAAHKETLGFQTEVKQLLKLMIHSLYSNKEIFLRELISNASDALDKLRFEAVSDDALYEGDSALTIRVSYDKAARTLTIADNGIGMNRAEVMDNIGTIAKSGTRQFFESLTGDQARDAQLIGQFGVGFYSAFIVADKVTLTTRRAGTGPEHGVYWESAGEGEYTIETVSKAGRGTEVVLYLREGGDEFLDDFRLRSIIRKYSDHIAVPIQMRKEPRGEEDAATEGELETVNSASALWARPRNEISAAEYHEFYKHVGHDFAEPLAYVHSRVEGTTEYTSLLYVPAHAPFDLWDRERRHGLKLYVRRVFIMESAEQLMPNYLRFIRGVVDSNDLPLNVSREILQHNKTIDTIRAGSVKKALGLLEDMAKNEPEKYAGFWKEFGKALKEGPGEDFANRERIARLLRFASTHNDSDSQNVALDDYIARMKQGQTPIYYITADSYAAARNSPHLEVFRQKGVEVLLLTDRVDEWLTASLSEYQGKPLQSVTRGALDLGALADQEEQQQQQQVADEYADLVQRLHKVLDDKVSAVRTTHRLTTSPACLVADEQAMSANLERILRSVGQEVPASKPILELNPDHPLVQRLRHEQDQARFAEWGEILFDQALLSEGGQLSDPAGFVQRINKLLLEASR